MKAVLLDVDGTLVDSNDLHVEAWREAFRRYGKEISREELHAQMGKGGDQIVAHFLDEDEARRFGKDVDALHTELFVRRYQPRERTLPGVRPLVERMKADGLRVVLASSAKEEELKGHLEVLGIGDLDPKDALVIGDTPWDAQAARKAGIPMVGVLTGGFSEQCLRENGAQEVYRDLPELLDRWGRAP